MFSSGRAGIDRYPGAMLRRSFWFLSGVLAGGLVTIRALRRKPTRPDLRAAALATSADVMSLAAKVLRPNDGRPRADAR